MAIIVEEEKTNTGALLRIGGWLSVLLILGIAAYYVFFANPDLSTIVPTGNLGIITSVANITLDPSRVATKVRSGFTASAAITLPDPTGPTTVGRVNPFLAP